MSYIGDNAIEMEPVETDNIGSLASLILAELPECNDLLVRQQLAYALREFCHETDACVMAAPVKFMPCRDRWGYAALMPAAPQGMIVGSILDVRMHGISCGFKVYHDPDSIYVPDYIGGHCDVVRYSVYPKAGGEVCPTWFKDRYAEAITAGAMYHLLSMSGRPWSDPQRAAEYGAKYTNAIAEAAYRRGSPEDGGPESAIPCGGLFM